MSELDGSNNEKVETASTLESTEEKNTNDGGKASEESLDDLKKESEQSTLETGNNAEETEEADKQDDPNEPDSGIEADQNFQQDDTEPTLNNLNETNLETQSASVNEHGNEDTEKEPVPVEEETPTLKNGDIDADSDDANMPEDSPEDRSDASGTESLDAKEKSDESIPKSEEDINEGREQNNADDANDKQSDPEEQQDSKESKDREVEDQTDEDIDDQDDNYEGKPEDYSDEDELETSKTNAAETDNNRSGETQPNDGENADGQNHVDPLDSDNTIEDDSAVDSADESNSGDKPVETVDSDSAITEDDGKNSESDEGDNGNSFDNDSEIKDSDSEGENPQDEAGKRSDSSDTSEKPERYESENPEMANKVRDITSPYYEQAGDLARNNEKGRAFTDHKEDHVEMVADKSLEAGDAIKSAVENGSLGQSAKEGRVAFSADIDNATLEGAALSHDTGMAGNGYALTPLLDENGSQVKDEHGQKMYEKTDGSYVIHPETNSDFDEVRGNHSLNSAINVLANRDQYKDAGYSDAQVDKMAAECMAHSKSSSGVSDLNSEENWSDCFDRIDSTVAAYNADHPDATISFDRSAFEGDDKQLGSLASETLALRVGDVSRDSGPDAEAHSGEAVHVDRSTIDDHAGDAKKEIQNADIYLGDSKFESTPDMTDEQKRNINFSRMIHAGEQNITDNNTFVGNDGNVTHEVTVADGCSAPKCTQHALEDHLGELASAKDGQFDVSIKFDSPCDDFAKESYEEFRDDAKKHYRNVSIQYPWDEEE